MRPSHPLPRRFLISHRITSLALVAATLLVMLSPGDLPAQDQVQELTKLNLKAIKKISFHQEEGRYRAVLAVVFDYSGDRDLRLRESKFKITVLKNQFIDGEKVSVRVPFGDASDFLIPVSGELLPTDEAIIPAPQPGALKSEGIIYLPTDVGPADAETVTRILQIVNVFGDPEAEFQIELDGDGEAALRIERGWITQKGVGIEFLFRPLVQREVLFE
jgi:hypothetical protein